MKTPVPVPSVVLEFAVVGFAEVLQQTPRAVTLAPPSEVMFPPLAAEVVAIVVTVVVTPSPGAVAVGPGGVGVDEPDLLQLPKINMEIIASNLTLILIRIILAKDLFGLLT